MRFLCEIIDKIPEMPYFLLALVYVAINPDVSYLTHVFSTAFFYLTISLTAGMTLKLLLKTKRPTDYSSHMLLKYGFPSLHSLISIGAIADGIQNPLIRIIGSQYQNMDIGKSFFDLFGCLDAIQNRHLQIH